MEGSRKSTDYDRKFIKVLIIACFGLDNVRNDNGSIKQSIKMDFIKDLFTIRCNNERVESFEALFDLAFNEIKNENFD